MTRDEKYLELIMVILNYTRDLTDVIDMTPPTRRYVRNALDRMEKMAKEI